jgi:hypothetical protein
MPLENRNLGCYFLDPISPVEPRFERQPSRRRNRQRDDQSSAGRVQHLAGEIPIGAGTIGEHGRSKGAFRAFARRR